MTLSIRGLKRQASFWKSLLVNDIVRHVFMCLHLMFSSLLVLNSGLEKEGLWGVSDVFLELDHSAVSALLSVHIVNHQKLFF